MVVVLPPSPGAAVVQACGRDCISAVTPAEMLRLADDLRSQGRDADADALLKALFHHPVADVRREARFRYARSLIARRHFAEAIEQLQTILVERPSAAPVRLDLAQALELSGDHAGALREFARLQAGALPSDLARQVDRVVSTLRSARPFGGSIEFGLAPDSNINGATDATTILINGLPFNLDRSARREAGLGFETAGQMYWRHPLAGSTRLVLDAIGQGNLYRDADFDGGSVQVSLGPEFANRMHPSLLAVRRWYLGLGYSWSYGGNFQWLKPIARRTVLDIDARVESNAVQRSTALDGASYTASIGVEHALRTTLFARISLSATRYQARSPIYATTSGDTAVLIAKDFGSASIYGRASYSHLEADGRFLGVKRQDDRVELGAGVSLHLIKILGAFPVLRVTHVLTRSSVVLYETSGTRAEMALSHSF